MPFLTKFHPLITEISHLPESFRPMDGYHENVKNLTMADITMEPQKYTCSERLSWYLIRNKDAQFLRVTFDDINLFKWQR